MKVTEVIEKIKNNTASSKEKGAVLSLRTCYIEEDSEILFPEYCFTLRQWREIQESSEPVTNDEFLLMFPHLKDYV